MKKVYLLALCLFMINQNVFASVDLSDENSLVQRYATVVASDLAVASTATVYSSSFPLPNSDYHGYYIKCSGSAVNVKVYIQGSYKDSASLYTDKETGANFITITDTNAKNDSLTAPFVVYGRFKIIGQSGNGADTKIDIIFFRDTKQK